MSDNFTCYYYQFIVIFNKTIKLFTTFLLALNGKNDFRF